MSCCNLRFLDCLEGFGWAMSVIDFMLVCGFIVALLFFICFIDWS